MLNTIAPIGPLKHGNYSQSSILRPEGLPPHELYPNETETKYERGDGEMI
jgi:hypothetical protein